MFVLWVVSYLKTTSNHNRETYNPPETRVVSYLKTTSNHNRVAAFFPDVPVVSYLKTTSNHNFQRLHVKRTRSCILFKNYIKPQPQESDGSAASCCILFKNYIKPQLTFANRDAYEVVSYLKTTSNHNSSCSTSVSV